MAHVADERFLHAVFGGAREHGVHVLGLIVRDDARQHRHDLRPLLQKRGETRKITVEDLDRHIYIRRVQRGKLLRELLGLMHLHDERGVGKIALALRELRQRQAPPLGQGRALFLQAGDEPAAQVVDGGRREIEVRVDAALGAGGIIGRAARFGKLVGKALRGQRRALRGLRHGAGEHGAVAFLVHDGGHDRLAGLHLGIKLHGHAAALAVGIRLARGGEHFFRLAVGLSGACAEHVRPFFPEQVALREALARERQREPVVFLRRGHAVLMNAAGVHVRDHGDVLRPLHAALDLHAGDARVGELLQVVCQAVVAQAQRVFVHAAAHAVLHAARLRAGAAVAAAAADERAHIALAGIAEAQRPVHEHLGLDARVLRDEADLLERELAREHGAGDAHLGRGLDPGEIVDAHLRAGVQRNVRQSGAQHAREAQILHKDRVRPGVRRLLRERGGGVHLAVAHEGVERDIDLAAADVTVAHGLGKRLPCEIIGAPARVESVAKAHIHRVRPVLHRRDDGVEVARGRQQFQHRPTPSYSHTYSIIAQQVLLLQVNFHAIM